MRRKTGLTHTEFTRFRPARRFQGTYFTLAVGNAPDAEGKCACVVSKKAAARAIDRNRIKRHCREALRTCGVVPVSSHTFIFYAKHAAAGASYADTTLDIKALIERALKEVDDRRSNSVYNSHS